MKTIVQVPVFNEERHLPLVINDIKKNSGLEEFSSTGIIVINDGSTDNSLEIAEKMAVEAVVDLKTHCGLGAAFREGLRRAIKIGADIIVNTDADFQYNAGEIKKLVAPILENKADMVIGDRQIAALSKYPRYKYIAQALGNFLVSKLFKSDIKDATSGFRAFSRDCAQVLAENTTNPYTYTLESICFLLKENKRIVFVPVHVNNMLRESRLIRSKVYYVENYLFTVLRYALAWKRLRPK